MNKNPRDLNLRRARKPGAIKDVLLIQWQAIEAAKSVMYKAGSVGNQGMVLSAAHAITQASQAYWKLIEASDLEARVEELERELQERGKKLRRVA